MNRYRHVNKHLATYIYPLPRLEEQMDQVTGHNFYATLDMPEAYIQIILDENSRDLTAFSDGVTLYRFRRLDPHWTQLLPSHIYPSHVYFPITIVKERLD